MQHFPLFMDLSEHTVLVVGGGEAALRKVRLLHAAGARIRAVASSMIPQLKSFLEEHKHVAQLKPFSIQALAEARLAIVATDDKELDAWIAGRIKTQRVLVNVVDQPGISDWITPAIVDRGEITIAISSGGGAPVLARMLREKIEAILPEHIGKLAALAKQWQNTVREKITALSERRKFWEAWFHANWNLHEPASPGTALKGLTIAAPSDCKGTVYLVGAGPGDPDLLTLKALQMIQTADVILYDRLVSKAILDRARRDAEFVMVGKAPGKQHHTQDEINRLLIEYARAGKLVVRLKGGDPFVFGRGGEEARAVRAAGLAVCVVPGITAAVGCAAYAGIPLTHRKLAQSVHFITGHQLNQFEAADWQMLAAPRQTLVFYMGMQNADQIRRGLISAGVDPNTPAAAISNGTTSAQTLATGNIDGLPELARRPDIVSPCLLVIGEVVRLQADLAWFAPKQLRDGSVFAAPNQCELALSSLEAA